MLGRQPCFDFRAGDVSPLVAVAESSGEVEKRNKTKQKTEDPSP